MTEPIKITPVVRAATSAQKAEYIAYYILGAIEILLAFRFVFKLAGASLASSFVSLIYTITRIFVLPFEGIFRRGFTQGVETTAVFEPATVVAMLVYAVLVWGIVKFIHISSGEQQVE
jgi:hypothetical protein